MNPGPSQPAPDRTPHDVSDGALASGERDVLLTRLMDGRAGPYEWRALRDLTARDAGAWNDLIGDSERQLLLAESVACAAGVAERVHAPTPLEAQRHLVNMSHTGAPSIAGGVAASKPRVDRLGWMIAAVLAVGFVALSLRTGEGPLGAWRGEGARTQAPAAAGLLGAGGLVDAPVPATADEALQSYLRLGKQTGRVVAEVPQRIILEQRPLAGGGHEVLYVRQVIERAVVGDMYSLGQDDAGQPVMVPALEPSRPVGAY
jgi:hypothetical protein